MSELTSECIQFIKNELKMKLGEVLFDSSNDDKKEFAEKLKSNDNVIIIVNTDKQYKLGIYIDKRIDITNDFVNRNIKYLDLYNKRVYTIKEGDYDNVYQNSDLAFYLSDDNTYLFQLGVGDLVLTTDFVAKAEHNIYDSDISFDELRVTSLYVFKMNIFQPVMPIKKAPKQVQKTFDENELLKKYEQLSAELTKLENNYIEQGKEIEAIKKENKEMKEKLKQFEDNF